MQNLEKNVLDKKITDLLARSCRAPQKSPEWLMQRHNILTSSEVASALDSNLHESSLELLKRKCSPLQESDLATSSSINWGEKYEPVAKEVFERITNEKPIDVNLIIHEKIKWLGASPDGVLPSKKLLEIKCPFHRHIVSNRVPYYYWIQVQMQLEVCDFDECYFFQCRFEENDLHSTGHQFSGVHADGTKWYLKKYTMDVIKRDRDWFARSLPLLTQFWQRVEHYRIHGLGKLMADMGGKQVYYNLQSNQLEVLTRSPSLLANVNPPNVPELQLSELVLPASKSIPQLPERGDNVDPDERDSSPTNLVCSSDSESESDSVEMKVILDKDSSDVQSSPPRKENTLMNSELSPMFQSVDVSTLRNWDEWVSATAVRNYLLNDPLLDWLDTYGKGSSRVNVGNPLFDQRIAEYEDDAKDVSVFNNYLQAQGIKFEDAVVAYLYNNFPKDIVTIANPYQARQADKVAETIAAMQNGIHIIYQAVLHNESNKTYGVADLLIRSDIVNKLFAMPILSKADTYVGCAFNKRWHYVVVDIKHVTLCLRADGTHLLNSGSAQAYKGQLYIYNLALGEAQKYTPDSAYMLGRKWNYTSKGEVFNGNGWFDRMGVVNFKTIDSDTCVRTDAAIQWVRDVRQFGRSWSIDPPSRVELYPNMCNDSDAPWHATKKEIAKKTGEITSVYYAGINNRNTAVAKGITSWRDERCTAEALGHKGPKLAPVIDAILDINRSHDKIRYGNTQFKLSNAKVCFYIDFETINDVIEDIRAEHPITTSQAYIFMIGIGWKVRGKPEWNYRCLTADTIDADNEKEIFLSMHDTMLEILEANDAFEDCTVYHWSHAEKTFYDQTANKYIDEVGQYATYLTWEWFDLYKLFVEVPITVRGALTFSLKDIAPAMKRHGFIATDWPKDGILDGLNAMIKAAECSEDAKRKGISMTDLPVMKRIIEYNEVDCKVMMEIVEYITNDLFPKPAAAQYSTLTRKKKRTISEVVHNEWHEIPTRKTQNPVTTVLDIMELPKSTARKRKAANTTADADDQSNPPLVDNRSLPPSKRTRLASSRLTNETSRMNDQGKNQEPNEQDPPKRKRLKRVILTDSESSTTESD